MQAWNWARILGNTIAAFATAAVAINIAGVPQEINVAFYAAAMTAMLAFAKELQAEGMTEEEKRLACKPALAQVLIF